MIKGRRVHDRVSFDVNPTSRQILENLDRGWPLSRRFVESGARIHQRRLCNVAASAWARRPATDRISLRTVPRNFPGRSGTRDDLVYLVSPETAAASALAGTITDPRTLEMPYPTVRDPDEPHLDVGMMVAPPPIEIGRTVSLERGPNVRALPDLDPIADAFELPVLLVMGDDVSTDEILPAGARVLPFRSNIDRISEFAFDGIDRSYPERARAVRDAGGHAVVGGRNYGQGSSREHAALAPRSLGLRIVIAIQFARIHRANLINFGVLPLVFADPDDHAHIAQGDRLAIAGLHRKLRDRTTLELEHRTRRGAIRVTHGLSPRQIDVVLAGGLISWMRRRLGHAA